MLRFALAALIGTAMSAFAAQSCGGHGGPQTLVVSTDWLAAHLRDPKLTILAVCDRAAYDRAHIPGAAFLRSQDLSSRLSALTLELPPMADLADTFGALGIGNDSRIVVYVGGGGRVIQATRTYLTLDAMGLGAQTSILDGGFDAWQSEGRPTSAESPAVKRGTLTPCPQSDVIVDSAYVSSNLRHRGVDIVDARAPEFYTGQSTANGKRTGQPAFYHVRRRPRQAAARRRAAKNVSGRRHPARRPRGELLPHRPAGHHGLFHRALPRIRRAALRRLLGRLERPHRTAGRNRLAQIRCRNRKAICCRARSTCSS
jgi:thiosulfate/3-mercaptopyruvate sulfurtransferase